MEITGVDVLRDGGTIIIRVTDDLRSGKYLLPTPFIKGPRHIAWNGQDLTIGSPEEKEFLMKLKGWWDIHLTMDIKKALENFDEHPGQSSMAKPVLDFLYIRTVIKYLEPRHIK